MIPPTVQQLRLFEAVARRGSITRAAEEVNLTQPTVSMQVKALEGKVGMALTEQVGKALHLTHAGEEVAAAARDVLERLADMETALSDMQSEVAGPISVAVVSTARYFLPQLLGRFKRAYPKVEPRLQITNRETLLQRMEENRDDLYIMGQPPEEHAVIAEPFRENIIVPVAWAHHPLAGKKNIPLARIAEENVIRREVGSGTRKAVERLFQERGLSRRTHMEFDDSEAIKQGVISGLGIGFLSIHALRLELASGEIAVLDVEGFPLHRRWYAAHRKEKRLTGAARTFLEYLLQDSDLEVGLHKN
ncbi:MAG: LysR family transcriptional regulator [Rhodobacteraceae bacterium]|nr:LysR family transcriptional regulator [Paracoccaceae bacterium]